MTTIEQADGGSQASTSDQQASGASVFWALACIVLNAMSQSSFCGSFWHGDDPGYPPGLYRSLPTICLLDAVADIWIMADKHRSSTSRNYQNLAAKPTNITIRLTVFIFAVMPQAVKLFSIKGIGMTQVFAGFFLVCSLVSIARSLCLAEPQEDLTRLVKHLQADEVRSFLTATGIVMLGWLPHVALMYGGCLFLSPRLHIPVGEDIVNAMSWVDACVYILWAVYALQQAIFIFAGFMSPIPPQPILNVVVFTGNLGISDMMQGGHKLDKKGVIALAYIFLFDILLCSYLMTVLLDTFAKALTQWLLRLPASSESVSQCPSRIEELELTSVGVALSNDAQGGHSGSNAYVLPDTSHVTSDAGDDPPPHPQSTENLENSTPTSVQAATISGQRPLTLANTGSTDITVAITPASQDRGSNSTDARRGQVLESSGDSSPQSAADVKTPLHHHILFSPVLVYFGVLLRLNKLCIYAFSSRGFGHNEEVDATAHEAAERGEAGNRTRSHEMITWQQRTLLALDLVVRFILRLAFKTILRVMRLQWSIFDHTWDWMKARVRGQSKTCLLLALTIANFAIAMMYYLIYFDGAETFTPSWTKILGKF